MQIDDLVRQVQTYLPTVDPDPLREAYAFALAAHDGQVRLSGEPYVQHPLSTAMILAGLNLDMDTVVAALLHDVPEDTRVPLEHVRAKFGDEVAKLVDGVTKLSRISWENLEEEQAESLRKMFLAMAEDVRVVMIKLADRLHNMRTLSPLPRAKQHKIARETLEIYAPLASRLGIWQFKWELEDLSFRFLEPDKYRQITEQVAALKRSSERYINRVIRTLSAALEQAGIEAQLQGRSKHVYSIHKKMQRKGQDLSEIYDLLAVRVIVEEVKDCYAALGVIHSLWKPIPGEFDDYIAMPKENLYQSLHTAVFCLDGLPLEVQIRTEAMHRVAEFGIAAHWRYKEGGKRDVSFDAKLAWLRQLMEWRKDIADAQEFVESLKTDIFQDQVFVFTPKGDIIDLPAGATPIDFAYRIHTDIGHRCRGAKVNGRLVNLDYRLQNGDRVEILTGKAGGPSRDWLNPNLNFVKSAHARDKIRSWFRKQQQEENILKGKEQLDKELRQLALEQAFEDVIQIFENNPPGPGESPDKMLGKWHEELKRLGYAGKKSEELVSFFKKFTGRNEIYLAIGYGDLSAQQLALRLLVMEEQPITVPQVAPRGPAAAGLQVMGVGDLLTNLGRCCNPLPGDEIIGYVTRGKGITVHRRDCRNVAKVDEPGRLVRVSWGGGPQQFYPVSIIVRALDREGLLRDVATVVAEDKISLAAASAVAHGDHTATITATLQITGIEQLGRVLTKIESIKDVIEVVRDTGQGKIDKAKTTAN
jgi:GTP pyrophosphokinase